MLELDLALDKGEEGVVSSHAYIVAGLYSGASLPHDDGAGAHQLTIVTLDTEALGVAVPSVAAASPAFFMSHLESPFETGGRARGLGPLPRLRSL